MTAQYTDTCIYQDHLYTIIRKSDCSQSLFDPHEHGLITHAPHTACRRGFCCRYWITDALYLEHLEVYCGDKRYPDIFGRSVGIRRGVPYEKTENGYYLPESSGLESYSFSNRKIEYTGKILTGYGFADKYYYPTMAFQMPYAYKNLLEFEFENGDLINTVDHSENAARYREMLDNCPREKLFYRLDFIPYITPPFDKVGWED